MLSGVGVTQAEAYSARGGEGGEVVERAGVQRGLERGARREARRGKRSEAG